MVEGENRHLQVSLWSPNAYHAMNLPSHIYIPAHNKQINKYISKLEKKSLKSGTKFPKYHI